VISIIISKVSITTMRETETLTLIRSSLLITTKGRYLRKLCVCHYTFWCDLGVSSPEIELINKRV